ncbi:MAG: hypothetical protein AB7E52_00050 [Bdellovibrionales bacterium]
MIANNRLLSFVSLFFAATLLPSSAFADTASEQIDLPTTSYTAPAMFGVGEFQIQHARLVDPRASAACGTSSGEVMRLVEIALKGEGLSVFTVLDAAPPQRGVERVDIYPDVATVQPRETECSTWVALTAQSRAALRLDPVSTPRNMVVTYWSGGLIISSTTISHPTVLKDSIQKLAEAMARQYRSDQPTLIKDPEKVEKK